MSVTMLVARLDGFRDTNKSWWECDTGIACMDYRGGVDGSLLQPPGTSRHSACVDFRRVGSPSDQRQLRSNRMLVEQVMTPVVRG
jgi:hypothetical protein